MDKVLFLSLLLIFSVVYFIIGYYTSLKIKSLEDYFLAGRGLGFFPLIIALIATQLGGGIILGTSEKAYSIGYYGLAYVVGICIGFIALALGVASRLRTFNVVTTAQLFETRYGSSFLRKVASLCSILSLCGIFAAQVLATHKLMESLGVYNFWIFVIFWLLIVTYAMMGGLKAIVSNDIFQLTFIIVVFVGLFLVNIIQEPYRALAIAFKHSDMFRLPEGQTLLSIGTVALIPALYSLIEQDLAQIFFSARNAGIAVKAALTAAFFMLIFSFIPVFFGMQARLVGINSHSLGSPLISFFDSYYGNIIVTLIVYGVLAAIISTANSLLCAISSNIVQDFKLWAYNPQYKLLISKIVMGVVGLAGLTLGLYATDIIGVLVASYNVPVTALFVSLIVSYFSSNLSLLAAYLSVFTGVISFAILVVSNKSLIVTPEIDALLLSAGAYVIGIIINKLFKNNRG